MNLHFLFNILIIDIEIFLNFFWLSIFRDMNW